MSPDRRAKCFALSSPFALRMDTARSHLLGADRPGYPGALGLRVGTHCHDQSQWLVRCCPAGPGTYVDARDYPAGTEAAVRVASGHSEAHGGVGAGGVGRADYVISRRAYVA